MARINARIQPCLWFDDQAEEAARFYVSVFPNSRLLEQASYTEAGREQHGKPQGSPMVVTFELDGQPFMALNGGPHFRFSEAISLVVHVQDQAENDRYWNLLSAGGDPAARTLAEHALSGLLAAMQRWRFGSGDAPELDLVLPHNAAGLADDELDIATQASAAWEAAVCWDDDHSRQQLAQVRPL